MYLKPRLVKGGSNVTNNTDIVQPTHFTVTDHRRPYLTTDTEAKNTKKCSFHRFCAAVVHFLPFPLDLSDTSNNVQVATTSIEYLILLVS